MTITSRNHRNTSGGDAAPRYDPAGLGPIKPILPATQHMLSERAGAYIDEVMAADALWFALHPTVTSRIRPVVAWELPDFDITDGGDVPTDVQVVSLAPRHRARKFIGCRFVVVDIDPPKGVA